MMTYEQFRDVCDRLFGHVMGTCPCTTGSVCPVESRQEIVKYLSYYASTDDARRTLWATIARELFLSVDAVAMGYGLEDVMALGEWLTDEGWL